MLRRICLSVMASLFGVILSGCGDNGGSAAPETPADEPVKTSAEYKQEADQQITEENVDQQMAQIEKEMQQEETVP